jgi:hypothetical protein
MSLDFDTVAVALMSWDAVVALISLLGIFLCAGARKGVDCLDETPFR